MGVVNAHRVWDQENEDERLQCATGDRHAVRGQREKIVEKGDVEGGRTHRLKFPSWEAVQVRERSSKISGIGWRKRSSKTADSKDLRVRKSCTRRSSKNRGF